MICESVVLDIEYMHTVLTYKALINSLLIIIIIIIRARTSHPLNYSGFNSRMVHPIIQSSRNGMQATYNIVDRKLLQQRLRWWWCLCVLLLSYQTCFVERNSGYRRKAAIIVKKEQSLTSVITRREAHSIEIEVREY